MHSQRAVEDKSPVNLRIRTSLKEKAKRLGLNLSQALEVKLEEEISHREREAWLAENRGAIDAYNKRVEEHGPALSAYRSF
jgi:antitoxin CcdA